MFAHINVSGIMSGALTTGDTLTGGTSGATGTIESISTDSSATITGITQADPAVVTCSGGHHLQKDKIIIIASVGGMTDINTNHTVKNPTATTFELFAASTATNSHQLLLIRLDCSIHIWWYSCTYSYCFKQC